MRKKKHEYLQKVYWIGIEELHVTKEGFICRGQRRLVVPDIQEKGFLNALYVSYKNIVSTKLKLDNFSTVSNGGQPIKRSIFLKVAAEGKYLYIVLLHNRIQPAKLHINE